MIKLANFKDTKKIQKPMKDTLPVVGLPFGYDIGLAVQRMFSSPTSSGFQTLRFTCNEGIRSLVPERDLKRLEEDKRLSNYLLDNNCIEVKLHVIVFNDNNRTMRVVGRVQIGTGAFVKVVVLCSFKENRGTMHFLNVES